MPKMYGIEGSYRLIALLLYIVTAIVGMNSSTESIVELDAFSPGQIIEGFILEKLVTTAGLRLEEYWTNFLPSLLQLQNTKYQKEMVARDSSPHRCFLGDSKFCLDENIFNGGHGEIWRGHKIAHDHHGDGEQERATVILKRMKIKDNPSIHRCALREIYFGKLLQENGSFPRLITHFYHEGDVWLIFEDEGSSLQSYLYNAGDSGMQVLRPSRAWKKLRSTEIGLSSIKSIMFQLISNTYELHSRGIVHRDIKPSNILLQSGRRPKLLTSDFSSAMDKTTMVNRSTASYYGLSGPTIAEETLEYAPPEVLLSLSSSDLTDENALPFDLLRPASYDIWSVGIVFLEILLGTPHVFDVDQRTEAMIVQLLLKKNIASPVVRKKALFLAGLANYGILGGSFSVPDTQVNTASIVPKAKRLLGNLAGFSRWIVRAADKFPVGHLLDLNGDVRHMTEFPSLASLAPETKQEMKSFGVEDKSLSPSTMNDAPTVDQTYVGPCGLTSLTEVEYLMSMFSQAILHRDILGIGLQDRWAIDLLFRLLCFDPSHRISMDEAMKHAFFHGAYVSSYDGQEFATVSELIAHNKRMKQSHHSQWKTNNVDAAEVNDELITISSDVTTSLQTSLLPDTSPALTYRDQVDIDFQNLDDEEEDRGMSDSTNAEFQTIASGLSSESLLYSSAFQIDEIISKLEFYCPKCGRRFDARSSCIQHAIGRRHSSHCAYYSTENARQTTRVPKEEGRENDTDHINPSKSLTVLSENEKLLSTIMPQCMSDRSFGIRDVSSGWCDLQGKRRYMEDFHSIYHHSGSDVTPNYTLFAVYDGHLGSFAARYAAHRLHLYFQEFLDDTIRYPEVSQLLLNPETTLVTADRVIDVLEGDGGKEVTIRKELLALRYAFLSVDQDLGRAFALYGDDLPIGGTTATVVIVEKLENSSFLVIAHVGDSRLVLCKVMNNASAPLIQAVAVTVDHTTSNNDELQSLQSRGGRVVDTDGTPRVEGDLIITRSLGDSYLGEKISPMPDVVSLRLNPLSSPAIVAGKRDNRYVCDHYLVQVAKYIESACSKLNIASSCPIPHSEMFAILASDGLWDVMTNSEAVEMVCMYLLEKGVVFERYIEYILQLKISQVDESDFMNDTDNYDNVDHLDLFQGASRLLAYEALIRGSLDNIGVSVIDLLLV